MNTRRNRWMTAIFALCLLGSAFQPVMAGGLRSSVNSTKIGLGDTFELTLSVDSARATSAPDLSPLQKDFQILGTGQSSQVSIVNGKRTESFSWVITLAPNEKGRLTIPAITAGSSSSDPLVIEVTDAGQALAGTAGAGELSIEVTADPGTHYVQEEIPVTVRIQGAGGIRQASLETPSGSDFVLTQTGEDQVSHANHNGKDVSIIERHYFLKPQKSGSLTVPPLTLQATVDDPSAGRSSFFSNSIMQMPSASSLFADMFNPGRQVTVRSQPLKLEVKPRPTGDAVWFLPAKRVELYSDWEPANPQFRVGEAVTRKISLFALGAADEQLPDIPISNTAGARLYVDRSSSKSADTPEGTAAIREFDVSIVPTQPGEITLPAVEVRWWDTVSDQEQVATLPAQTIQVAAVPGLSSGAGQSLSVVPPVEALTASNSDAPIDPKPGFWSREMIKNAALSLLAIMVLLTGIGFKVRYRGKQAAEAAAGSAVMSGNPATTGVRRTGFALDRHERALVDACKANDLRGAYAAFNHWILVVRQSNQAVSPELLAELAAMEELLYAGPSETAWNGKHLLELLGREKQSRRKSARNSGSDPIPGLYPA